MDCIKSQELPTFGANGAVTLSAAFNATTEANICGCEWQEGAEKSAQL